MLTNIHRFFSTFIESDLNSEEISKNKSGSWQNGTSFRHARGRESFESVYGSFFFVRVPLNAVKINNSPRFTSFAYKRSKKYAVKNFFTAFHTKIHCRTSTRLARRLKTEVVFVFGYFVIWPIKLPFIQHFS